MVSSVPQSWERRRTLAPGERDAQRLDVVGASEGSPLVGLSLEIALGTSSTSMVGVVLEPGRYAVGLVETELPPAKQTSSRHWEIRGQGLWADHVVETPLIHWSCGLEAFALGVEEADELIRTGVGHRVPLGWELEFEASDEALALGPASRGGAPVPGFRQFGRVHGVVMDERGEWDFEGMGIRTRWWGTTPPSFVGATSPTGPEEEELGTAIDLEVDDVVWSYRLDDGRLVVRNNA